MELEPSVPAPMTTPEEVKQESPEQIEAPAVKAEAVPEAEAVDMTVPVAE